MPNTIQCGGMEFKKNKKQFKGAHISFGWKIIDIYCCILRGSRNEEMEKRHKKEETFRTVVRVKEQHSMLVDWLCCFIGARV